MKLLILSDTHLDNDTFKNITNSYPDMDFYLHCGDSTLYKDDPLLKKYLVVEGNHDQLNNFDQIIHFDIESYHCMITHGNLFKVHYGNNRLIKYMEDNSIDIAFHGHTHVPTHIVIKNKHIINPGSVMMNRGDYCFGTFAIATISKQCFEVKYYHSTTFEECSEFVLEAGKITLEEFKK